MALKVLYIHFILLIL